MTDRLKGVYVAFNEDYREDDAEQILAAIRMIRGVAAVTPMVTDSTDWIARVRVKAELTDKIWDALLERGLPADKMRMK